MFIWLYMEYYMCTYIVVRSMLIRVCEALCPCYLGRTVVCEDPLCLFNLSVNQLAVFFFHSKLSLAINHQPASSTFLS